MSGHVNPQPMYLLFLRVCGPDPDDAHVQVRLGFVEEPTEGDIEESREVVQKMFAMVSTEPPARVGVAVLPWVSELDEEEEDTG